MTNLDTEKTGYLIQQYDKAVAELEVQTKKYYELEAKAKEYLPAVEQAARSAEHKLKNLCEQKSADLVKQASSESLTKSLTLVPACKYPFVAFVVGLILLFGIPYFLGKFFGLIVSIGIYVWLVRTGMKKQGLLNTAKQRESIQKLSTFPVLLMHFSDKESSDSTFPYLAVRAPVKEGESNTTTWKMDKQYGDLKNADFLVINSSASVNSEFAFVHIPENQGKPQVIGVRANTDGWDWPLHCELMEQLGTQTRDEIKAIQSYAEHAEESGRAGQQVDALLQRIKTLKEVEINWSDVSIEEETLDRILKLVDLFISGRKPSPKGVLLYGPPGTGKTLIARKLAKHADCHFEAVNIADLKAGHIGQTAPKVKELWKRCRENAPTILFVDECESAFAKRGGVDNDSFGNELVQTFISEWDGFNQAAGQVFVIGATNRFDILDTAVLSRFTSTVEIGLPSDKERRKILENEFNQADFKLEVSDELVTETTGMSGRDIHTLVATLVAENFNSDLDTDKIVEQVRKLRGKSSTQIKTLSWEDIILPEHSLNEFMNLGKELRNSERLEKMGISTPKGILLYGPPGTGKTQIARVLAGQSGLSFIAAATSDLKANYTGQSGSKVKALFERARSQAPCIVFIDEIDIVAGSRGGSSDGFVQEIVGQLLQEIDGVASKAGQVFLLAASNHPDNIDSALLSRFERKIEIGLPDESSRAKILALLLQNKPVDFDVVTEAENLAAITAGLSGRDLSSLVTRATRKAVSRAMMDGDDIENIKISMDDLNSVSRELETEE
ncbi:AAA family ATPase [Acinetobacter chinensis]|uniref:AAA family ATPase n=1 Tax=Acinetobacter chinensis TaxID=2004650 RepID=UPI002934C349|nr:AAA family ATPase [Acinetobacter chinensis]WOE42868.1 AAA family ATPase [Acinetobacter chinensis]